MPRVGRRIDRTFIASNGRPVLWEKAILRTDRRYDGAVPFFKGSAEDRGYHYEAPQQIKALLTSDARKQSFDPQGSRDSGAAQITFDAALEIGPQDRITFLDMPVREEMELVRGAGGTDLFRPGVRVVEVLALRDDTQAYSLTTDARPIPVDQLITGLDWSSALNAPSAGERYGMLLSLQPSWIVEDQPRIRGFGQVQLLKTAHLLRNDARTKA